jgi:hypothetical protein
MNKLFKLQYNRFLTKYLAKTEETLGIESIKIFTKKFVPRAGNSVLIKKYPISELKNIARLECNIEGTEGYNLETKEFYTKASKKVKKSTHMSKMNMDPDETEIIINSSKILRASLNVKEKLVCNGCSKKDKCPFFEKEAAKKGTFVDLQVVLYGMYMGTQISSPNLSIQQDQIEGVQNPEIDDSQIDENGKDTVTKSSKIYTPRKISNKDWTSANTIMELVNDSLEDMVNNNGIILRTLINSMIEAKKEEDEIEILSNLENENKQTTKEDPYQKLLQDLKECKNRRDKRRILAKFNKSVGFGWGEYSKVSNPEPENTPPPKDPKNENHNLPTYDKTVKALEHFSQKINMKNAKYKQVKSQEKMSLLVNQNASGLIEDSKSRVKVPGKLYKNALKYIEHDEEDYISRQEKIDTFNSDIQNRINRNSVNLDEVIDRKRKKVDRILNENKKFTLQSIEENQLYKSLESSEQKQIYLQEFEQNLIEEEREEKTIKTNKTSYKNDLNSNKINKITSSSENYLTEKKQGNVKAYENYLPSNEIQIKRSYSVDSQLTFYKQENPEVKRRLEESRINSKLRKIQRNKHIYTSQHHYNNDMEHFQYEKDADVSRTIRFEKSIKR